MVGTQAPAHLQVQTADFEEAVDSLRSAFGEVEMRRAERGASRFAMRAFALPDVSSTRWSFSGTTGGTRADDDDEQPVVLTGMVVGGGAHLWAPGTDVDIDTTRPFLYPELVDSELDQPDFANLGVTRSAVEARARAITGLDDFTVRFTRTAPIDQIMDQVWRDTMAYAQRTSAALIDHPDAAIAQIALLDLTTTILLRTFPNTTLDAANQRSVTAPRRGAMRRALQYIDDNLDLPITVADIAGAAGLSTRGLYAGFQRDLDMSPMVYLRTARLHAARDELGEADPAITDVDAIAARWGFVDPKRFAHHYTAVFGESPQVTLQL